MSTQDQLEDDYRTVVSDLVRQPLNQALAQVKVLHEELAEDVCREVTGLAQAVRAARNAQDRAGGEHAAVRTQVQELTTSTRAAEAKAEAVVAQMRQLATASKEVTAQLADERARLGTVEAGLRGIAQQCAALQEQSAALEATAAHAAGLAGVQVDTAKVQAELAHRRTTWLLALLTIVAVLTAWSVALQLAR